MNQKEVLNFLGHATSINIFDLNDDGILAEYFNCPIAWIKEVRVEGMTYGELYDAIKNKRECQCGAI